MAPMLTPIAAPLAEPPRPGSGALLPTLSRAPFLTNVTNERDVDFAYNPENCGVSGTLPGDACAMDTDKDVPENEGNVEAWGFYAWAGDKCSPFELGRDWEGRARRQLDASLSFQVAHELWTGDEAQAAGAPTPYLTSEDSDVVTAGAVTTVTEAIALLEYGLGQCSHGARGVIHVTTVALTYMAAAQLVRTEGNLLLTQRDTIVIADAGYDGSGPYAAAADGSQWAYATGMPIVRLGPQRVLPDSGDMAAAIDRSTNTVEWRAEQKAAVAFGPCCHLAAQINLPWPDLGGAGS